MIRVIYRWSVNPDAYESFVSEWGRLTRWIRMSFDGSYGSTLLQGDADQAVGVARWASRSHLQAFRDQAGSLHLPGANLDSMEVLEEVAHLTDEAVSPS